MSEVLTSKQMMTVEQAAARGRDLATELQRYFVTELPSPLERATDLYLLMREVLEGFSVETQGKPARDAEHCDFPDCEQHWTYVLDMALAAMAKFHATFSPDEEDADLTPRTTSEAFREFVDEHARLMRVRASGAVKSNCEPPRGSINKAPQ